MTVVGLCALPGLGRLGLVGAAVLLGTTILCAVFSPDARRAVVWTIVGAGLGVGVFVGLGLVLVLAVGS